MDKFASRVERTFEAVDPRFTEEETDLFNHLKWTRIIRESPEWMGVLEQMPTAINGMMNRDELAQFAALVVDVEPISSVVTRLIVLGKQHGAGAFADRKKKEKLKEIGKEEKAKRDAEDMKSGMAVERIAREARLIKAQARRAKREAEWKYAHHHVYIEIPGEATYCTACVEARFEEWRNNSIKDNEQWASGDMRAARGLRLDMCQDALERTLRGDETGGLIRDIINAYEKKVEEKRIIEEEREMARKVAQGRMSFKTPFGGGS
jgi:hypothetical protein